MKYVTNTVATAAFMTTATTALLYCPKHLSSIIDLYCSHGQLSALTLGIIIQLVMSIADGHQLPLSTPDITLWTDPFLSHERPKAPAVMIAHPPFFWEIFATFSEVHLLAPSIYMQLCPAICQSYFQFATMITFLLVNIAPYSKKYRCPNVLDTHGQIIWSF